MVQPTSDTSVSRPELGALINEFRDTEMTAAIGSRVMPYFPVAEQSAEFPVIPKEVLLKAPDTRRAMRAGYPSSDFEFEMGYYATRENGWEEKIDDRERKLYARLFDAEVVATRRAEKIIQLAKERRIASKVFNATTFTAHSVTNEWDDADNATPIEDINTGKLAVRAACGMLPNTLIISYSTFLNLKNCSDIVDRLLYTFPGEDINRMTSQQLATIFDIERVLVGGAVYDSADKGQDASIADIWDNEYAMLTICSAGQDITEPCIGRTFIWDKESPGDGEPVVESYRNEGIRSDIIRVRHDSDERLLQSFDNNSAVKSNIASAVSYLFSNITT